MSGGTAATLTAVSIAMTVASTAASMYAQHEQQKAQTRSAQAAANYNAQVAANEAATQRQLAQNELAKGEADRTRQQRQAARDMGVMRANMGADGFEVDSGSNLSLLMESAGEHQYDSAVITSNAEQAAYGHLVGATNAKNQMRLANWQGANAGSGGKAAMIGMGGTLLGGIGAGIGQYNQMSQTATPANKNSADVWDWSLGLKNKA